MRKEIAKIKACKLSAIFLLDNVDKHLVDIPDHNGVYGHISRVRLDYDNYSTDDRFDIINENITHLNKAINILYKLCTSSAKCDYWMEFVLIKKAISELEDALFVCYEEE